MKDELYRGVVRASIALVLPPLLTVIMPAADVSLHYLTIFV